MWVLRSMQERVSFNVYRHIASILEALSNYDVSATFFVTGEIAKKHPRILNEICKKDHEIASHGYSHRNFLEISYDEAESEIAQSVKVLNKFQEVKGFRAPFLVRNEATYLACEKLGFSYDSSEHGLSKYGPNGYKVMVLPVISPLDTHGLDLMRLSPKNLVARWLLEFRKSNGATVCMHVWRVGRKKNVKAVLEPLLRSDLNFVRASDLVHRDGVALTFDVEYVSLGESLHTSELLKHSARKHAEGLMARDFLKDRP